MNYTLIRAHKRTLSLQVNKSGELIARAPYLMPKFLIDRFVIQKSSWIDKRLSELAIPKKQAIEYLSIDDFKTFIHKELTKYRDLMGLKYKSVRFTTVQTYWGTCTLDSVLSFNLTLRFTPPVCIEYVVVHELAHLRWRGHGVRFWVMVEKYYPLTKEAKKILRQISKTNELVL